MPTSRPAVWLTPWALGTDPSLVLVGHPCQAVAAPELVFSCTNSWMCPWASLVPTQQSRCCPQTTHQPRTTHLILENSSHNCWCPRESDPEDSHLFMHKTLPRLTWQHLHKVHMSAGKWTHRLLLTGAITPAAISRAQSRGYASPWAPVSWGESALLLTLTQHRRVLSLPTDPDGCSGTETFKIVVDIMPLQSRAL